ncbi:MAG: type IV pilin N-terminal domain-containing protein [Halalkalicoccus sp.]
MARGISPVIGVVLLVACTVALSVTVGAMAYAYEPVEPASAVVVAGEADAERDRITLTLDGGGPLDVRDLTVLVEIDGTELETQPPVPFFGSSGFSYAFGPFNPSAEPVWERGESAGFALASTNDPVLESGSTVEIRIYENGLSIATVETTAA